MRGAKAKAPRRWPADYSYRSEAMGLAAAMRVAWTETITQAITSAIAPASRMISGRYEIRS